MTPSDADEAYAQDKGPARQRAGRDVLEISRGDRGERRSAAHPRDLDDGEDDRGVSGRGRRDRNEGRGADDGSLDDGPRRDNGRRRDRNGGHKPQADDAADTQADRKSDSKENDGKEDGGKNGQQAQDRRKSRRPLIITIVVIVALLLVAGGVYYYLSGRGKASTDDAYTDGNIVAIAPQVSGQVISLDVNDNQFVHKGDPIVHIDPRQFIYSQEQAKGALDANKAQVDSQKLGVEIARKNFPAGLQLAQANLVSAKAGLVLQQSNYDRQKSLPRQATTQQEVDSAASSYQQAQAAVDQAQARLVQAQPVQQNIGQSETQISQLAGQAEQSQGQFDQANLNIEWAVVRAPQDGWVTRRNVNAGNYVASGTQIMSLVTTDVWVTANFKETELDGMRPGQHVKIGVDAYPDLDLQGHVDSIQRGSGSRFSAFPAENATGNFVKIVQRVPVKIVIDSGLKGDEPLPLGVSVEPTVTLK
jgi:membrane fusion protein (multidrug efflux system)